MCWKECPCGLIKMKPCFQVVRLIAINRPGRFSKSDQHHRPDQSDQKPGRPISRPLIAISRSTRAFLDQGRTWALGDLLGYQFGLYLCVFNYCTELLNFVWLCMLHCCCSSSALLWFAKSLLQYSLFNIYQGSMKVSHFLLTTSFFCFSSRDSARRIWSFGQEAGVLESKYQK